MREMMMPPPPVMRPPPAPVRAVELPAESTNAPVASASVVAMRPPSDLPAQSMKAPLMRPPPAPVMRPPPAPVRASDPTAESMKAPVMRPPPAPVRASEPVKAPVMRPPPAPVRADLPAESMNESVASATPVASQRPYEIPEWSHVPGKPYTLEVVKDGSVLEELQVSEKGAYMFGRHENCDFVLDHPSISRHHAVLQFKNNGDAFVFDCGSTHGTFVNKLRVKSKVHVPVHVGNIIRFGLSTRMYILQGPQELMQREGISRKDRHMLRLLEAQQSKADEEASLIRARADAEAAEGASWGMGEDAVEEEIEEDELTWQTYKGQLNERQQKTMDQIQKRNDKLTNLKKEIDAIQAKEGAQGGLTQGQQTQVSRNEKRIEELLEQLENLEENLNDSIKESVLGKPGKRKKKNPDEDDDDVSDDDYYDRTKKKQKKELQVETANSLLGKIDQLETEMEELSVKIAVEEEKVQPGDVKEETQAAEDPLDAFMSSVSTKIVEDAAALLRKEMQMLQAEKERLALLLKVADPSGEAARKWKTKSSEAEIQLDEQASKGDDKLQELSNSAPDGVIWIGAPRPEEPVEETTSVPVEEDPASEQFVHYKDRKEVLQVPIKAAKKEDETEASEAAVADDIALLLRHKKGLTSSLSTEKPEPPSPGTNKTHKKKKKKKRLLGPERPEFMDDEETEFDTWVPPVGQTGDGKTSLNEKYGY